jgi:hypothetical protein
VTENEFRELALAMPGAVEAAHMGHPDFRVKGKIFATIEPGTGEAVVKLTLDQQDMVCAAESAMVSPVKGGWGKKGWTTVMLRAVDKTTAKSLLTMAWRNTAPKSALAKFNLPAP